MSHELADNVSRATGLSLYGQRYCSSPNDLAEVELSGRSHYYDPETRRYFGGRVLSVDTRADGLVLLTVESVAHPSEGRLYRAVAFNLLGTVIHRTGDGTDCHGFKTSRAAYKEAAGLTFDVETQAAAVMESARKTAERNLAQLATA